jgi:hypothetical protein
MKQQVETKSISVPDLMACFAHIVTPFYRSLPGELIFGLRHAIAGLITSLVVYYVGCSFGPFPDWWQWYALAYIVATAHLFCRRRQLDGVNGMWVDPNYTGRSWLFSKHLDERTAKRAEVWLQLIVGLAVFYLAHKPLGFLLTVAALGERYRQWFVAEYRRRVARDMIANRDWQAGLLQEVEEMENRRN